MRYCPLQWSRVDFEAGVVRLAPDETKNGKGREFPFRALPPLERLLLLCSQSLFRFADLGDDGLCRGGPDKGCGVIVSAIDVVVDRLD